MAGGLRESCLCRDLGSRRSVSNRLWPAIASLQVPVSDHLILPDFVDEHPGGARVIQRMGGKDATKAFWKYHGESVLAKYGEKFKIGTVTESAKL